MNLWQSKKRDADLARELQCDLDLEEEEQREKGLPPEEARYAARRAFGNATLIREQTRAVWSWNRLEALARDLRYGLRTLRRTPGFTVMAVIVIALGIGANVALFTVVRGVLLKPLPFRDPERLVLMYEAEPDRPHHTPWLPVDAGSFWEWERATQSVAQMAMVSPFQGYIVSSEGGKLPDFMLRGAEPGYFSAIGLPLLKGRIFRADERMERANVVLISRGAAEQYFPGEDPIGKHVKDIGGEGEWEIIGIVGDVRWDIAQPSLPTLYWPIYGNGIRWATIVIRSPHDVESQSVPVEKIVGRLDPELPVWAVMTLHDAIGKSTVDSEFDSILVLGFAVIALVLAAVGLYGVLAYLVTQRTSEIGIRIALGARRAQLLNMVLLDGLRLAIVGMLIGLPASAALVRLIRSMLYETQPLDIGVFAAVTGVFLLVAIAACIAPAWHAARLDPMQALRNE